MTPKQFDQWRPIPRLLVALYGLMVWQVVQWFMGLEDPTGAQSAFVSTVVGAAAAWFGLYCNSRPETHEPRGKSHE